MYSSAKKTFERVFLRMALLAVGHFTLPLTAQNTDKLPQWTIRGTVTSVQGPERGVIVTANGPLGQVRATTNGDGFFELKGTVPGPYILRVNNKEGFAELSQRLIRVTNGELVEGIHFTYSHGAQISGRVRDPEGKPLAGMVVIAFRRSFENGQYSAVPAGGGKTNDLGRYEIDGLASGEYLVAVSTLTERPLKFKSISQKDREQFKGLGFPPYTFSPRGGDYRSATVARIREEERFATFDITMEKVPLYCLHVGIQSPIGAQGIPGVQTAFLLKEWWDTESPMIADGVQKGAQDASICGIPSGEYTLHLHDFTRSPEMGFGYTRVRFQIGKESRSLGVVAILDPIDVRGRLRLVQEGSQSTDFSSILIRLLRRNRSILFKDHLADRAQADGTFTITRAFVDGYGLELKNLPSGWYLHKVMQGTRDITNGEVRIDQGELEIYLESRGALVEGTVEDEQKSPVANCTVFLLSLADQRVFSTQSDQRGKFSFVSGFPKGDYRIVAILDVPTGQREDLTFGASVAVNGAALELAEGARKQIVVRVKSKLR